MSAAKQFRLKLSRIPQRIPLAWAEDPSSKRLLKRNEWLTGNKSRLPRHYVDFYKQWEKGPLAYIHEEANFANFEKDKFGQVVRVQRPRIPLLYPVEFHQGLWGGEAVVKGALEPPPTKHQPNYTPAKETYWFPKLHLGVVYSEILNKHIEVVMTERGERLIDESYGLDSYLLKTEVNEIYSHLGLKLKREMLLTMVTNPDLELYPNDAEKRSEILDKYKDYIIPHEVADWHGLPLSEALHKQLAIDRLEEENSIRPQKEEFRKELIELLKSGYMDDVDPALLFDDGVNKDPGLISTAITSIKKTFK